MKQGLQKLLYTIHLLKARATEPDFLANINETINSLREAVSCINFLIRTVR